MDGNSGVWALLNKSCFFLHYDFVMLLCDLLMFCWAPALPTPKDAEDNLGKALLAKDWSSGTDHV